jgi:hypothetical protein
VVVTKQQSKGTKRKIAEVDDLSSIADLSVLKAICENENIPVSIRMTKIDKLKKKIRDVRDERKNASESVASSSGGGGGGGGSSARGGYGTAQSMDIAGCAMYDKVFSDKQANDILNKPDDVVLKLNGQATRTYVRNADIILRCIDSHCMNAVRAESKEVSNLLLELESYYARLKILRRAEVDEELVAEARANDEHVRACADAAFTGEEEEETTTPLAATRAEIVGLYEKIAEKQEELDDIHANAAAVIDGDANLDEKCTHLKTLFRLFRDVFVPLLQYYEDDDEQLRVIRAFNTTWDKFDLFWLQHYGVKKGYYYHTCRCHLQDNLEYLWITYKIPPVMVQCQVSEHSNKVWKTKLRNTYGQLKQQPQNNIYRIMRDMTVRVVCFLDSFVHPTTQKSTCSRCGNIGHKKTSTWCPKRYCF